MTAMSRDEEGGWPHLLETHIFFRLSGFFLLALSIFFFLQLRETKVDVLEVGIPAPHYVVARVDFSFVDDEKTLLMRRQAASKIGPVFAMDETQLFQRKMELDRSLMFNPTWRHLANINSFEEVFPVIERVMGILSSWRFVDPATLAAVQPLLAEVHGVEFLPFVPPEELKGQIHLPPDLWDRVQQQAAVDHMYSHEAIALLVDQLRQRTWRTEEDRVLRVQLRQLVEESVPRQMSRVRAGEQIIEQGQIVEARHLVMMSAMKKAMKVQIYPWKWSNVAGSALIAASIVFILGAFIYAEQPAIFASSRRIFLVLSICVLTLLFDKTVEFLLLSTRLIDFVHYPIVIPMTAVLLSSLLNARVALFTSACLAIAISLGSAVDRNGFFLVNLLPAVAAVMGARVLHKRKEVFAVFSKAFLVALVAVVGLDLFKGRMDFASFAIDGVVALLFMLMTAVLVVGIIPLFEFLFKVMSDITLMEFMDPSHPLLKRLMVEAPGTYQHSLVVGNLSEAGAVAIGANGLFCRVATQYHDIGKLVAPQYFTENQQGGVNMHQLLTPLESAQVIISHVSEGSQMAKKAGLPAPFIEIIQEHHGTTLVYYFYHKQIELMGGDGSLVDERDFRYTGPKPRTKESAIIMIADSLEAASRCLDEYSEQTVANLVERIISEKMEDGQFDECQLTFEELQLVKRALTKTICAHGHTRVKYPTKRLAAAS